MTLLTTFQNKLSLRLRPAAAEVRLSFRIYFIFNLSTYPALMEAIAPDPTVGLVELVLNRKSTV